MTLLGASFSGTADYTTGASSATTTTPASSSIVIGNGNSDSAMVSGNATYGSPTGSVTFYECGPTASPSRVRRRPTPWAARSVSPRVPMTPRTHRRCRSPRTQAGYWCFAGFYSGDSNYAGEFGHNHRRVLRRDDRDSVLGDHHHPGEFEHRARRTPTATVPW